MLSDLHVRQAKPQERDYKLSDSNNLYLLVRPTGSKLWRFGYRFAGKQKTLALGAYPTVTLAEARERRDAARKLLANGKDPSLERRLEKIAEAAGGDTFREVAQELLDKHRREGRAETTRKKNRWLLEPAFETFGDRPIGEVTAPELLHALRKFEVRERYESARRLRAWQTLNGKMPDARNNDFHEHLNKALEFIYSDRDVPVVSESSIRSVRARLIRKGTNSLPF